MSEVEFEPEENSNAKNVAWDALEAGLEEQGFDLEDVDLIALADSVVEALLAAGVTIPENLADPHSVHRVEATESKEDPLEPVIEGVIVYHADTDPSTIFNIRTSAADALDVIEDVLENSIDEDNKYLAQNILGVIIDSSAVSIEPAENE